MRAVTTAASAARHVTGALAEATLAAAIVGSTLVAIAPLTGPAGFAAGAGTAVAGGKTSDAVWIAELANARGSGLGFGNHFTVGYSTSARQPWAQARCYPTGSTVYGQTYADGSVWSENFSLYAGGPMPQAFELTDPIGGNWTGGGADCVLRLVKYSSDFSRYTVIATSNFAVNP